VLADDQAGNGFQHFAGTVDGAGFELLLRDDAGIRRVGDAKLAAAGGLDADRVQGLFLRACQRRDRRAKKGSGDCSKAERAIGQILLRLEGPGEKRIRIFG
jgi:hypothetical protein